MDEDEIKTKIKQARLGRALSVIMSLIGVFLFIAFFITAFLGFIVNPAIGLGNGGSMFSNGAFRNIPLAFIGIILIGVGSILFSTFSNIRAKYDTGFKRHPIKQTITMIEPVRPTVAKPIETPKPVKQTKVCQYCGATNQLDNEKCTGCGSRIFYYKDNQ